MIEQAVISPWIVLVWLAAIALGLVFIGVTKRGCR